MQVGLQRVYDQPKTRAIYCNTTLLFIQYGISNLALFIFEFIYVHL